jgi:hypothetical protein
MSPVPLCARVVFLVLILGRCGTLLAQPDPPNKKALARMLATVSPDTFKKHRIPASALTDFHPVIALTITGVSPAPLWVNQDYKVSYILSNFTLRSISGELLARPDSYSLKAVGGSVSSIALQPGQSVSGEFQGTAGPKAMAGKVTVIFGRPLQCRPNWPSGEICPEQTLAANSIALVVNDVGSILTSRDPLPGFGAADGSLCHNALFARSTDTPNEWEETAGGHDVPVAGRVINTQDTGVDIPFDHPFGFDYWFHIEPDQAYFGVLNAPGIAQRADCSSAGLASGKWDGDTCNAFDVVRGRGQTPTGALHTEVEQGLIPKAYLPQAGDRIYARGHRIIDCGHPDYNAELHPPTMMARAWQDATLGQVRSTLIATPYVTRQSYVPAHDDFVKQVATELAAVGLSPSPSPLNLLAEVDDAPIDNSFQAVYQVAIPPRHNFDKTQVSFHFVTRPGVTVSVQQITTYQVVVTVNVDAAQYSRFGPPTCTVQRETLEDAEKLGNLSAGTLTDVYKKAAGLIASGVLTIFGVPPNVQINVAAAAGAGLLVYKCSVPNGGLPQPGSTMDNQIVVDSSQPYPVYGWLNIDWVPE